MDETPSTHPRVRVVTVGLMYVAFAITFVIVVTRYLTLNRGMIKYPLDNEVARLASTLFFDKMTALAQLTVGLFGAAWAFLSLAETRVQIRGGATTACFVLANLALLASLLLYLSGYDLIVVRMFHHLTFDIDAPFIRFVSYYQQCLFIQGCVALGATVVLGRTK